MSEPGITADNQEQPKEHPSGENEPENGWCQYFQLRWAAFCQLLSAHKRSRKGDDQKGNRHSEALGSITTNWLNIVFIALIIAGGIYLLNVVGIFDDSNKVIALLTFVLAVVGTLQWWTYHRQWQVMREQLKHTDELVKNSRLDHRPWLIVDTPKVIWGGANTEATCQLIARNIGKSPARVITCRKGIFPISTGEAPWKIGELPCGFAENRIIEVWKRNWAVAPGGALNLTLTTVFPIKPEIAADIEAGNSHICIYGELEYDDVFGEIHLTEFQFMYHWSDKTTYTDDWHNKIK